MPKPTPSPLPQSSSPAPDRKIIRELGLLHPTFRASVQEVLHQLFLDRLPFRVFESFRSPARQAYLYAQGRTRPGKRVTNAQPWQSMHQYGLAVDFALFINGGWSWREDGEYAGAWDHLREVGEFYGMRGLEWEKPHLQMDGVELEEMRRAIYPSGGDPEWWDNLNRHIREWTSSPPAPKAIPPQPPQPKPDD